MRFIFIKMALKNLRRHWRKSLITGSCLCLGFIGITLLGGYMWRMENYLTIQGVYLRHVGHLNIYKKNGLTRHLVEPGFYSFTPTDVATIRNTIADHPDVEWVGEFIHGQGLITNGCQNFPVQFWASDKATEKFVREHPLVKTHIPLLTNLKKGVGYWENQEGILVTSRLASLLNKPLVASEVTKIENRSFSANPDCHDPKQLQQLSLHSEIQLVGNGFEGGLATLDTQIIGQYSTGFALSEDSTASLSLSDAKFFFNTDLITSMSFYLKDITQTAKFERWLKNRLESANLELDFFRYDDEQVNPFYVGSMRFVYIMNGLFFIIVCGVVVLSLVNSLQITILERKNEIGTLLTVGFRQSHVKDIFIAEALIIALLSIFIAIAWAYFLAWMINGLAIPFDIVGNAEKLILIIDITAWYCLLTAVFLLFLVFLTTRWICTFYLKIPLTRLLERVQ